MADKKIKSIKFDDYLKMSYERIRQMPVNKDFDEKFKNNLLSYKIIEYILAPGTKDLSIESHIDFMIESNKFVNIEQSRFDLEQIKQLKSLNIPKSKRDAFAKLCQSGHITAIDSQTYKELKNLPIEDKDWHNTILSNKLISHIFFSTGKIENIEQDTKQMIKDKTLLPDFDLMTKKSKDAIYSGYINSYTLDLFTLLIENKVLNVNHFNQPPKNHLPAYEQILSNIVYRRDFGEDSTDKFIQKITDKISILEKLEKAGLNPAYKSRSENDQAIIEIWKKDFSKRITFEKNQTAAKPDKEIREFSEEIGLPPDLLFALTKFLDKRYNYQAAPLDEKTTETLNTLSKIESTVHNIIDNMKPLSHYQQTNKNKNNI